MFNPNFLTVELAASVIGSYITMHLFGGDYFSNLAGNLFIMTMADIAHWYLNQPTLLISS